MKIIHIQLTIPDEVQVEVRQVGVPQTPHDEQSAYENPPLPPEPTAFRGAATQQPSSAWHEGQSHDPAHKPLKTNARGLFCPTKLQDGTWCPWRAA
jgi:hypothetical protein